MSTQDASPELVMTKTAMLLALEQTDELMIKTVNLDMRESLSKVHATISAYDIKHVNVAGVLFNLLIHAKCEPVPQPQPPPRNPNSVMVGDIEVVMS